MARKKNRQKIEGRFINIPFNMLNHPVFIDLSTESVRILVEFKKRFNGTNNGEISLSTREAAKICKCGSQKANKAIHELIYHGFIFYEYKGSFTNRKASTFKLTFEKFNGRNKTDDWKAWPANDANENKMKYLL